MTRKNITKCCRIVSRDSLCIEFHGVLAMILRDTQSRARVSFFPLFVFRHAISPLVSAKCFVRGITSVVTIICLSSRCDKMIEQKGGQLSLYEYLRVLLEMRKTDGGIGDFLVEWKFRNITGYVERTLIKCSATESET